MTPLRPTAVLVFAAALVGCHSSPSPTGNAAAGPPVTVHSEAQNRLHQMSDLDRAIGLKRAIYDAGSTCKRVTESRFIGPYKNMDMWAVRCADKRDWALFVGADDSVQVRLCKDTEAVGLPSCKLDESPPAPGAKKADAKTAPAKS